MRKRGLHKAPATECKQATKRVLLVAPFFPPVGGVASLRSARLARHLPSYGWEPIVVTRKAAELTGSVKDPALLITLPPLKIIETGFWDLAHQSRQSPSGDHNVLLRYRRRLVHLVPPDPWVGWVPFAYRACRQAMTQYGIHAVLTEAPPQSTNLIGYALRRRTGLPWLAGLADEWTHHPGRKLRYRWQTNLDKRIETKVLGSADGIFVTSPAYRDVLASERGLGGGQRVIVVPVGYDREDFCGEIIPHNEKFTLTLVGSLDRLRETAFRAFRAAVEQLLASGMLDKDQFRFRFVGEMRGRFPDFEGTAFGEVVERTGFLPHAEAVQEMRRADALLSLFNPDRMLCIPGKTFEYLAARRPTLALVPKDGATADLLRSYRRVTIVDPSDGEEAIAAGLTSLFHSWQRGEHLAPRYLEDDLSCYEAAEVTRSVAQQLDAIAEI